jgi:hypothetical protein
MLRVIKKIIHNIQTNHKNIIPKQLYRVVEITENNKGLYSTKVQIIGTRQFFTMKPEEILADDKLTAAFHPLDIRLLTYLGYCGINTPQYKILAKKILANEKIQFALYDNQKDSVMILDDTNLQTIDDEMIKKLKSKDAYDLGFSNGRKSILEEKALFNKAI